MDEIAQVAARLARAPVLSITHAASGGNSRIYRVETADQLYAMKYYPPAVRGARDRLGVEVATLRFFEKHGVPSVPKAYGNEDRFALYDWIEGAIPDPVTLSDVDRAADFLSHLPNLSKLEDAAEFIPAAEACLSLSELLAQIERRRSRLSELAASEPGLADFLARIAILLEERRPRMPSNGTLSSTKQCLVPSDFGFRNTLKSDEGLTFIDFEYFGWDDPAKLVADTLLHPGHELSAECLKRFYERTMPIFAADPDFAARFHAFLPLFSLRWALILCNEFLPEKRANRAFASNAETDWEQAKTRQLKKAEAMLEHPALALR